MNNEKLSNRRYIINTFIYGSLAVGRLSIEELLIHEEAYVREYTRQHLMKGIDNENTSAFNLDSLSSNL